MRAGARSPRLLDWKAALGIGLSLALLYFALRGVDAAAVLEQLRLADPFLFLGSIFLATAVFLVRAWRWRLLLQPIAATALRPRFAATTIGYMANNLLPARMGEFARAYALSRMQPVSMVASFGSLVVERLFDGFTVVAFLFLAMALPAFPGGGAVGGRNLEAAAAVVTVVFGSVGVVLVAMVLWPRRLVRLVESAVRLLPRPLRRPLVDVLEAFLDGLAVLRQPRLLVYSALWSAAVWLVGAAAYWLGFLAFGLPVGFTGALFLQSLIALAVALPSAPGFFGIYEAGVRVGLVEIWGVELNPALSFAIGFHIGGFIPVTAIGLYYLWRLGLSLREVERSEALVEEAVEAEHPETAG